MAFLLRRASILPMRAEGVNTPHFFAIALAGYFGQFIPVYIIYAVGGAFIAFAGLFGWFALPKETYNTQRE